MPAETPEASAPRPQLDGVRRLLALASFVTASERANPSAQEASSSTVIGVTRFVAELYLRGELRSATAEPVEVEFVLRRLAGNDGNEVSGTVCFLDGNARIAANRIDGSIHGRTINLRETASSWVLNRPSFPVGRSFVIQLAEVPIRSSGEINGTWSFGTQTGTLALVVAPPW